MNFLTKYALPIAVVVILLFMVNTRLEDRLSGAIDAEQRATEKAWRSKAEHLIRDAKRLTALLQHANSLRKHRPAVTVDFPIGSGKAALSEDPPILELLSVPRDTLAVVTINDTSYSVPRRVGEYIAGVLVELATADSLARMADTVAHEIPVVVAAADTALTAAKRKPFWLVRLFGRFTVAVCGTSGAVVGGLAGGKGAIIGAAAGGLICSVLR